jgi:hypothetical protein
LRNHFFFSFLSNEKRSLLHCSNNNNKKKAALMIVTMRGLKTSICALSYLYTKIQKEKGLGDQEKKQNN